MVQVAKNCTLLSEENAEILSMSHHGHWDLHLRTYSASQEPTWKPTVTAQLVPVPQNYMESALK